jgi:glycosyltransferase involved in cell wall biosynthesis
MKVLIITKGFLESTLSLANALGKKGVEVEVLCTNSKKRRNLNVIDFSQIQTDKSWITKEDLRSIVNDDMYRFLSAFNLNFHFKSGDGKHPISLLRDTFKLRKYIKAQGADIIHFVQGSIFLATVASMLPKNKIVFSLHEITNHFGITSLKQKILLNFIIRGSFPLIVHSEISSNRFINYAGRKNRSYSNPIHVIYFGLFEVYRFFEDMDISLNTGFENSKSKILLFFGRITPYKGINTLFSAFELLEKQYGNIHLIVAGNGHIAYDISGIRNITVINRPVKNEEVVYLIKLAYAVVCPYHSASQSGIPMISYLFGKPVIATAIGAFSEVVIDMKTGLLVSPNDIDQLKNAISNLISDQELYEKMTSEIKNIYTRDRFNWDIIAQQTMEVYGKRQGQRFSPH